MTATPVTPPVFIHPLADRHGMPSALLLDARGMQPETAPLELLQQLADGSMVCYFRDGLSEASQQLLLDAGWLAAPADEIHHSDTALDQEFKQVPGTASWIEGEWFLAPPPKPVGSQAASRALALKLVQLVSADADTHEIEALLRQDPTLSYHLLRLVNSLGMGAARKVSSFSQAILILGRAQLRRWLNLMLFSARESDQRSAMLLARVAVRARSMELLAREAGYDKAQQEQAFMGGMFSLLGVLFGMSLAEVLQPLTISEELSQALLQRAGTLGQLLSLVEAAEHADLMALTRGLRALQIEVAAYNQIQADAYLWMQAIAAGKSGNDAGNDDA
ncbi:EAL and HDOD domain-containing protein [Pseudoduganella danionis]|uniref:EAL and HDOD domain-containing protein n=1 Tax=Pseudoduganella danionis TaxID=1890295 RepID=UPI0035ADC682